MNLSIYNILLMFKLCLKLTNCTLYIIHFIFCEYSFLRNHPNKFLTTLAIRKCFGFTGLFSVHVIQFISLPLLIPIRYQKLNFQLCKYLKRLMINKMKINIFSFFILFWPWICVLIAHWIRLFATIKLITWLILLF